MKITKLIIPNYRQFRDFEIDFTYPKGHIRAGEPLDKVCFIGKNGTGKSTLLKFLKNIVVKAQPMDTPVVIAKIEQKDTTFYSLWGGFMVKIVIDKKPTWLYQMDYLVKNFTHRGYTPSENASLNAYIYTQEERENLAVYLDTCIFSPAESYTNDLLKIKNVPETTLNDALKSGKEAKLFHCVSNAHIANFWQQLIFSIKQREEAFHVFAEENSDKSYKNLRTEFEEKQPYILKQLALFWDKMLGKVGLYFDYESAKKPIQLTDNLLAYIKLSSTNQTIPYNELSTGIRNFIFRLGHIFSLFFAQETTGGFLLVDEPENSLFPDFRYDLIGIYQEIMAGKDTQFFVATHDPIIAAQFEPCERIVLDFDEMGYVIAEKGTTPEGDDPNDILIQDFGIHSLLGKKGIEMWEKCVALKIEIRHTENLEKKKELLSEYMKIAQSYHFPIS